LDIGAWEVSRAEILAKAAVAGRELADALAELARDEDLRSPECRKVQRKGRRRPGVRVPADSPTVIDEVMSKRAEMALRRAGIVTR
jgi:hypothetical protein